MRILHTGDWHFGKTLEGRSRIEEQAQFIDELVHLVADQKIDVVIIAGDVYDSVNPSVKAEQLFYEAIARLTAPNRSLIAMAGNHDHPERIGAVSPLLTQNNIALLGLPTCDAVPVYAPRTGENGVIAALPYPSEVRLDEILYTCEDEQLFRTVYSKKVGALLKRLARQFHKDTINIAASHLYVLGGMETDSERPIQIGGAYTVDPADLCVGAQYTALGHLHRPQNVKGGDGFVRYCGSPLAYSFSEAGQTKSVTIIDASVGQCPNIQQVYLSSGRPLVHWQAKRGLAEVYQWLDEARDLNAYIDLKMWLDEPLSMDHIQQLRTRHDGIVHICPIYPSIDTEEGVEQRSQLPLPELFRSFYARQTGGASPDEGVVQLFLELVQQPLNKGEEHETD